MKKVNPADLPLKVASRLVCDPATGCWLWTGRKSRGYGYCSHGIGNEYIVHRLVYQLLKGPIPEGLTLDHLCRTRHCANPSHLDPVTLGENVRRGAAATKTECKYGHALAGDNLYWRNGRLRGCRECHRRRTREFDKKRRHPQVAQ